MKNVSRGTKKQLEGPQIVDRVDGDNDKETPQDFEIEDAVRTMQRAHKIQKDPKMMKHVNKHIGHQITSLKDLKKLAGQKAMDDTDQDGM